MKERINIRYDTGGLLHYKHSPNNYSHFILGNLLEFFIFLKDNDLLDCNINVISNNPSRRFESFYGIFRTDLNDVSTAGETERLVALSANRAWAVDKAKAVDDYIGPFANFVKSRLRIEPGPLDTLTYVRRAARPLGRFIINENAIVRALENSAQQHGLKFDAVYLEKLTFDDQVALMSRTKCLVGPHGAGLVNSLFCEPGAGVIEISLHPDFVYSGFPAICASRNVNYARIHATRWWFPTLLSLLRLPLIYQPVMARRIRRDRMVFVGVNSLAAQVEHYL